MTNYTAAVDKLQAATVSDFREIVKRQAVSIGHLSRRITGMRIACWLGGILRSQRRIITPK